MAASLTRTVGFHALHHLYRRDWSEARNREAFGQLSSPHGHDYQCAVTVTGPLDETGMVVDLTLLDAILHEEVVAPLAGKHLNREVPAFAGGTPLLPTCEALATHLFARIASRLPRGVALERVRIAEDATLYGDCTGLT
jgi:6-pyruvoyltetrahydropterin/6-carboxytetrahydropterin synthase